MNTAKKFWETANKTPDLSFETLCALTLEVCELSEFPEGTFSDKGNRWIELKNAWNRLLEGEAFGVFLDVVHRAMWGFPYCWGNPKHEEIVRIVAYEMVRERDAFEVWDTCDEYEAAIYVPVDDTSPWLADLPEYNCSEHHYEYLTTRMLYRLRFSKRKYRKERKACEDAWGEYIRCIGKIVPASKNWNEVQWANENNIHNEIQRLYGIDYREDMDSYHKLYSMLTLNGENRLQRLFLESWYASHVKELPIALARVIWPKNTESIISQMFMIASTGAEKTRTSLGIIADNGATVGVYTYQSLRESWLYKWMYEVYGGLKNDETVKTVKRMLFDVAMYT